MKSKLSKLSYLFWYCYGAFCTTELVIVKTALAKAEVYLCSSQAETEQRVVQQ